MLPFGGQTPAVDEAIDEVHRRYGKSALTRAVLVGRDPGLEMPRLPD
jgi:DNA polymerase-4